MIYRFRLTIAPRTYCGVLTGCAIGFLIIHIGLSCFDHRVGEVPWLILQLFDLDQENNLPTWFSSFLLLNTALLLLHRVQTTDANFKLAWRVLAAGFLILSVDEVAGLHESFNTAVDFNWAIPGGLLVILLGLAFIPFLRSLDRRLAFTYVLSGAIYVSGAVGVELASEHMIEDTLAYALATALEEGLEMFGVLLFFTASLRTMAAEELSNNSIRQV